MIGTIQPNFFDRVAYVFGRTTKALPPPGALYQNQGISQGGNFLNFPGWDVLDQRGSTNSQDEANSKLAMQSAWVYSDVQAIANEFASSELMVKQRRGDTLEDVANHELERLWDAPNGHMGRSFVSAFWAWSYTLTSKAFLYWVPKTDGTLGEVWPIPPFMIRPIADKDDFIKGYAFRSRADADPIMIPAKYVTYSHSVNLFNVRDGMSFLVAALTAIKGDLAASQWNLNYFGENNGIPEGLLAVGKDTNDGDLARVRMEIKAFFGGTQRGVAVARSGDLDYKPFGRSQKDMEFMSGREFSSREIGRALGFPDGYWSETANRANAVQARATRISGAVWPLLVRLSEDMNAQLLPKWYGKEFRVEFKDIRPEDRQMKIAEGEYRKTHWTLNELREADGKDPLDDPRGLMLIAEIGQGTPIPATPASDATEEAISAAEAEAGMEPPAVGSTDPAPVEDAPAEEAAPEAVDIFSKATDLDRWERKAIKALRGGKGAAVRFESSEIDADTHARISAALTAAQTVDAVKAAFAPDVDAIMDAAEQDALDWARKVMGDA